MTIVEIDNSLMELRKRWVFASEKMRDYIEARAKMLKSLREDLVNKESLDN